MVSRSVSECRVHGVVLIKGPAIESYVSSASCCWSLAIADGSQRPGRRKDKDRAVEITELQPAGTHNSVAYSSISCTQRVHRTLNPTGYNGSSSRPDRPIPTTTVLRTHGRGEASVCQVIVFPIPRSMNFAHFGTYCVHWQWARR